MSAPAMTIDEVRALLEAECKAAGGVRVWALEAAMSAQFVSAIINGKRPPSERICRALGIREDGLRWVRL